MLETIDLADASGIIANFTGGSDLSFVEVMESLKHLQEMANPDATIIPGIVSDERMEDRVQVILVLTGIGATSVDNEVNSEPISVVLEPLNTEPILLHTFNPSPAPQLEMASTPANLDVPAFLRNRVN